jgi:hypothetical protein
MNYTLGAHIIGTAGFFKPNCTPLTVTTELFEKKPFTAFIMG